MNDKVLCKAAIFKEGIPAKISNWIPKTLTVGSEYSFEIMLVQHFAKYSFYACFSIANKTMKIKASFYDTVYKALHG